MPKISFTITKIGTEELVGTFPSLSACVKHLKKEVKKPENFMVNELEDDQEVETFAAAYFLAQCRKNKKIPASLFDI